LLVGANHLGRWHERWMHYRLLAELCRAQRVLAPLGWTLPVRDVARIAAGVPVHRGDAVTAGPRDAWVAWYFAALRHACPLPTGTLAGVALERAHAVGQALSEEQLAYHRARRHRSERAGGRLARWGEVFFLLALAGVVAKIALELLHGPALAVSLMGLVCAVAPAASFTFLGIRAYAEFELLAEQSARMRRVLAEAARELETLPLGGPCASGDLGAALLGVATAMLLDIEGWAQLFRVKAVEAG
jgi:hypothetical protein